jgi:hypothetical protein
MSRVVRTILGCVAAVLLGLAPAIALAATQTLKASSGALKATMKPPATHQPKVNTNVWITVTATLNGKPAHATAKYEFLFGGAVVSTQYPRFNPHFSFTGHFTDNLVFPASAVGEPLTLRVVIKADSRTVYFDWSIMAHK